MNGRVVLSTEQNMLSVGRLTLLASTLYILISIIPETVRNELWTLECITSCIYQNMELRVRFRFLGRQYFFSQFSACSVTLSSFLGSPAISINKRLVKILCMCTYVH